MIQETEPFLRLNEILDHMISVIEDIEKHKKAPPPQVLNPLRQELLEGKKIADRIQHENKELIEMKHRLDWVEMKVKSFEAKNNS